MTNLIYSAEPPELQKKFRWEIVVQALLIFFVLAGFLTVLVFTFDYTTNQTSNGIWKSVNMRNWMTLNPERRVEFGVFLYFPASGLLSRILHFGFTNWTTWQKMAVLNSIFAGVAGAFLYLLILLLTRDRLTALLGVLFHLGCGFVLLLATICEDIMPGYAFFVGAAFFLTAYSIKRNLFLLFLAAQCFALSWLFHWTMLAAAPAFLVALLFTDRFRTGLRTALLFTLFSLLLPAALSWIAHYPLKVMIWPGKGIGTGWQGLSLTKIILGLFALGQYVFGARNHTSLDHLLSLFSVATTLAGYVVICFLAVVYIKGIKHNWRDPSWRINGVLLMAVFVFAELMNFNSQPQDPQMQLQPMFWVSIGFSILVYSIRQSSSLQKKILVTGLAVVPLLFNASVFYSERGKDSFHIAQVEKIESVTDPKNTFFVVHGFDDMAVWSLALWDEEQRHILQIAEEPIRYPQRIPFAAAMTIVRAIDDAYEKGFRIVAGPVWDYDEATFVNSLLTVTDSEKARTIYRVLKKRYDSVPLAQTGWGRFYLLTPKQMSRES